MNTPIYDFVTEYCKCNPARFHMPGHKGMTTDLGMEARDITEIDGAGNLWDEMGSDIIADSEKNASDIFGCQTFYSTEGSSLVIRGMLFLLKKWAYINDVSPFIIAGRNAHKTFVNTAALLDIDVRYIGGRTDNYYAACNITAEDIEKAIISNDKPVAVYITTPDYLGNIIDVEQIAKVCHKYGVLLLVDNAHGAYLKFLSQHPIDLGADMCCDSAHKTLPVITGGAYLHISKDADKFFSENAKSALGMFGSTSPSYLCLQSLDLCNRYLDSDFKRDLDRIIDKTIALKEKLISSGYRLAGNEPIKLTIDANEYGYTGLEIADILKEKNIYPEHVDDIYVVFMMSASTKDDDLKLLGNELILIPKRDPIKKSYAFGGDREQVFTPQEALYMETETVKIKDSVGRVLSEPAISCPPCVPIYMAGERITKTWDSDGYVKVIKEGNN